MSAIELAGRLIWSFQLYYMFRMTSVVPFKVIWAHVPAIKNLPNRPDFLLRKDLVAAPATPLPITTARDAKE